MIPDEMQPAVVWVFFKALKGGVNVFAVSGLSGWKPVGASVSFLTCLPECAVSSDQWLTVQLITESIKFEKHSEIIKFNL